MPSTLDHLAPMLGATFIDRLTNPKFATCRIGSDTWTRHQLAADIGVGNVAAAARLTAVAEEISAKNLKDFYHRSSPYSFATKDQVGETTLFVAFRLFAANGFDEEAWYHKGVKDAMGTFRTLKIREQKANARTKKPTNGNRRGSRRATK